MTLDQHFQLWNTIGTWVAGAATVGAVILSLHLARRAERIRVLTAVGVRLVFAGDGTPAEEHVGFTIVNLGDRSVTINSIGWRVGKGKNARHSMQRLYGQYTAQYPKQLVHGEQATFMVSFLAQPSWPKEFATGFVQDLSQRNLRTLRALIHTSVGETIEVKPEENLLQRLREVGT
ncbi:hypothetical protein J2X66_001332 [Pseudomonas sp. 3296]|jgi:hypothetical protein|uniref:hypothetical protein n=1 Tax=Pseudomonas sp. 3296 TaxID=2817753 RepID=UPI002860FAAA|nr:hypothetical protein [Pseudomonas sp. 3296]MDR6914468.1 hypothetical protein [Pseudomonas sp. 3296]